MCSGPARTGDSSTNCPGATVKIDLRKPCVCRLISRIFVRSWPGCIRGPWAVVADQFHASVFAYGGDALHCVGLGVERLGHCHDGSVRSRQAEPEGRFGVYKKYGRTCHLRSFRHPGPSRLRRCSPAGGVIASDFLVVPPSKFPSIQHAFLECSPRLPRAQGFRWHPTDVRPHSRTAGSTAVESPSRPFSYDTKRTAKRPRCPSKLQTTRHLIVGRALSNPSTSHRWCCPDSESRRREPQSAKCCHSAKICISFHSLRLPKVRGRRKSSYHQECHPAQQPGNRCGGCSDPSLVASEDAGPHMGHQPKCTACFDFFPWRPT